MVNNTLKRIIIAAVSSNGVIGRGNKIPWNIKQDFHHFKKTTLNSPVIMGRNTFVSLGGALPDRLNIVITSSESEKHKKNNLMFFNSLFAAYQFLRSQNHKKIFIAGGSRIYSSAIKYAEEMIISHMDFHADGDIYFPNFNNNLWEISKERKFDRFTVKYYLRKK